MNNIITKHKLWNLQNEKIAELTKRQLVRNVLTNEDYKDVAIERLLTASNPTHLLFG